MPDSVQPHRRQPTRLPRLWNSLGKNTGVGCHFLLQCMKMKSESEVAQSCPTLSDPMDCSLPGSSIHGIFQARVPEWGAIAFSTNAFQFPPTFAHCILKPLPFFFHLHQSHLGPYFSNQGSNLCPLQWKHRVLTTELQKSQSLLYLRFLLCHNPTFRYPNLCYFCSTL